MMAIGRLRLLGLSFVLVIILAVMAPAAMASSDDSPSGPSIQILEPGEGDELSGKRTITVSVSGGKGQMVAVYFDMVGLSHDMITEDTYQRTVEIDTSKHYDGEHLINVHVHPPSGTQFHIGKLKVTTANGNTAPNGDRLLPDLEIVHHKFKTDANLLKTRVILKDDGPIEGAQVLSHINRAIGRPSSGRRFMAKGTGQTEKEFHAVYRVHLLPFQTDVPQEITIRFFITDAVGRANFIDSKVLIPAATTEQLSTPLPRAEIVNMDMFQESLPEKVHVRLENAHMATAVVLWLGDKVLNTFPLNGTETEVQIPVRAKRVADFFAPKIGGPARATAVWVEFRPKVSEFPELANASGLPKKVSIPVLGHKHINPIDPADLGRPSRQHRSKLKVKPFLKGQNGGRAFGETVRPVAGDWTKVTLTIPSGTTLPLKRIGIRFSGNKSLSGGPVYIDDITIGPNHAYSFEEGSVAPWTKKRDGIVELRTSTEQSRSGNRSMEVVLSGGGSKGFLQLKGLRDISAGDVLTFYVYTPSTAPALEKLVAGAGLTIA